MGRGKEIAQRLVKQLRRDLKGIGWGAKKRALEAAGVSRAYLENVKPDRIPLGTYFDMLDGVGIDARQHTQRALSDSEPIADFLADARNIEARSGVPRVVRLARTRAQRTYSERFGGVGASTLWKSLQADPGLALAEASDAVTESSGPGSISQMLEIWARGSRALSRFDEASVAIATGLNLDGIDANRRASLVGVAGSILKYRESMEWASALFREALVVFLSKGDLGKAGTTLVELGVAEFYRGRIENGERLCMAGGAMSLPTSQAHGCVLQISARCRMIVGDFGRASHYLDQIDKIPGAPRLVRGTNRAQRGDLLRSTGNFRAARNQYDLAAEELGPWPYYSFQAAVHSVAAMTQYGDCSAAAGAGRALGSYFPQLGAGDSSVGAKIEQVVAASRSDRLELAQLEELIRELELG